MSKAVAGDPLTAREFQVARLVAEQGLASKEIGRRLEISESVVKTHLTRIFIKLGIKKRAQIHIAMGD